MKKFKVIVGVLLMSAFVGLTLGSQAKIRIGFLVKQPEEPWFQNEWKFADLAGKELNFEVIKIGTTDGEKVLSAIDNLAAQGAKGFVICTPDTKLGPAIMNKAKAVGIKVLAVDDQFIGADGKPMLDVPYLGISAVKIGETVGQSAWAIVKNRKLNVAETGLLAITFNELQTARDRINGAESALKKAGFPAANIFEAAQKTTDTEGGFNAANVTITQNPKIKNWIVIGLNDETVIGGVRALEGRKFSNNSIIGVGIGGASPSINELKKNTGFAGTVLLAARQHGYDTAKLMFNWVSKNQAPPKDTRTSGVYIDRQNYVSELTKAGLEDQL